MPFYNGTLFQINEKEMLRYAGMNPSSKDFPPEEVRSAVREESGRFSPMTMKTASFAEIFP